MERVCVRSVPGPRVWLFVLCAILLLSSVTAIRTLQSDAAENGSVGSLESIAKDEGMEHTLVNTEETEQIEVDCDNLDEEECLNRRTLAAHTDYIYTQHHGKP
eukprot:Gb_37547 [translate_table: standard]